MANLAKLGLVTILCDPNLDWDVRDSLVKNLSGAVFSHHGKYLWLGTDEFAAIERFTRSTEDNYLFSDHQRFYFKDFINNFDEEQGEVDIEGLDYSDGCLWVIGSHSSKRKKVKVSSDKLTISGKELKKITREENRYLLVRIPLNKLGEIDNKDPHRAWLKRTKNNNSLSLALARDEYLQLGRSPDLDETNSVGHKNPYIDLPSKENGLDIEGLAVRDQQLAIGLRGPVLRGIAILLTLEIEPISNHELILKNIGDNDRPYQRHFLDLDGLGIRELCWEANSDSLLILAGPTMDLDGEHTLFRLHHPFTLVDNSFSSQQNQQLQYLGSIPHGKKQNRAEGLTIHEDGKSILVVYDSPAPSRLISTALDETIGVHADIFDIPSKK